MSTMVRVRSSLCLGFAFLTLAAPLRVWAHAGHDDAPGNDTAAGSGPIEVSEMAQRNLGLETQEAELRPIETTVRVIGQIIAAPDRSATVSSRIAGRVTALLANEGDPVRKGEPVVEIESRQIGDPPPRVRYPAPIDGVVVDRDAALGDEVEPSGHLLEIADLRELLAQGRVFEGQIGQVTLGQKVRVYVPSFPDASFAGVVERVAGTLDAGSRSLPIYVRIKNPDLRLRPSMRAQLELVTGGSELALAIPRSAVLGEAGAFFAFVQDDRKPVLFERRPLVLGVANDQYVEVVEGILPGERVVAQGNYSLQYLAPATKAPARSAAAAHEEAPAAPETSVPARFWLLGMAAGAALTVLAGLAARIGLRLRGRSFQGMR